MVQSVGMDSSQQKNPVHLGLMLQLEREMHFQSLESANFQAIAYSNRKQQCNRSWILIMHKEQIHKQTPDPWNELYMYMYVHNPLIHTDTQSVSVQISP